MIFEGRNKDYGAYKLRVETPRRLTFSLCVVLAIVLLPFAIFLIINFIPTGRAFKIANVREQSNMVPLQDKFNLSALDTKLSRRLNSVKGKRIKTVTVPVVKSDDEVSLKNSLKAQADLLTRQLIGDNNKDVNDTAGVVNLPPDIQNITGTKELRIVEQLPEFPGGAVEFMKWLTQNLTYPQQDQRTKKEGRVVVQFNIGTDGVVSDIKVVHHVSPSCDSEVLRVMRLMPKWKPGMAKGEPTPTRVVIPVVFKM